MPQALEVLVIKDQTWAHSATNEANTVDILWVILWALTFPIALDH